MNTKTKFKIGEKVTFTKHHDYGEEEQGFYAGKGPDGDKVVDTVHRRKKDGTPENRITKVWGKITRGWKDAR